MHTRYGEQSVLILVDFEKPYALRFKFYEFRKLNTQLIILQSSALSRIYTPILALEEELANSA